MSDSSPVESQESPTPTSTTRTEDSGDSEAYYQRDPRHHHRSPSRSTRRRPRRSISPTPAGPRKYRRRSSSRSRSPSRRWHQRRSKSCSRSRSRSGIHIHLHIDQPKQLRSRTPTPRSPKQNGPRQVGGHRAGPQLPSQPGTQSRSQHRKKCYKLAKLRKKEAAEREREAQGQQQQREGDVPERARPAASAPPSAAQGAYRHGGRAPPGHEALTEDEPAQSVAPRDQATGFVPAQLYTMSHHIEKAQYVAVERGRDTFTLLSYTKTYAVMQYTPVIPPGQADKWLQKMATTLGQVLGFATPPKRAQGSSGAQGVQKLAP